MPSYEHICTNTECNHEWEDFYGIKTDPPTTCPKCSLETAQRVISGGSGKGIMYQTDAEFAAGLKGEVAKIKQRASKDENYMANLIGEDRAHKKLLSK